MNVSVHFSIEMIHGAVNIALVKAAITTPLVQCTTSFRALLQSELARRCAKNPKYSLRAFADQLGIDHSSLSQMLRQRRAITPRAIRLMGTRLKLDESAIEAFVEREATLAAAPSPQLQHVRELSKDLASVVCDLSHFAILELVRLKSFKPDSRWIARVLGLTVDEVNLAITRLLHLGLLEMSERGRWLDKSGDSVATLEEFTQVAIRQLSQQVRRLHLSAMHRVPADLRDHSSTTIAIDAAKLPAAFELVRRFRGELVRCLRTHGSADDVYQLEISLFPVTRISHSSKKENSHGSARRAVSDHRKKS